MTAVEAILRRRVLVTHPFLLPSEGLSLRSKRDHGVDFGCPVCRHEGSHCRDKQD